MNPLHLKARIQQIESDYAHRIARSDNDGLACLLAFKEEVSKAVATTAEPDQHHDLYLQIGKEMVALTSTVHTPDEWLAIPALWQKLYEDYTKLRDRVQAEENSKKQPGQQPGQIRPSFHE